jgi:hypothetical protein
MTLLNILFLFLLAVTILIAFVRGGQEEKIGVGIYVLGCALTVLAGAHSSRFASEETGIFVVDCLTFAAFFVLALYADRFWPIWVTALLAIALFGHAAMLLSPGIVPWAYAVILSIWSYPILAIMIAASLNSQEQGRGRRSSPRF